MDIPGVSPGGEDEGGEFLEKLGGGIGGAASDQADPQIPMSATADVTIQAGDAKQELAVPVTGVQSDTTGEFVMVYATDGSTRRVDVVSGKIQADDTVVVTGDLQIGDQVMLVQSTAATTNNTNSPRGGGVIFGP